MATRDVLMAAVSSGAAPAASVYIEDVFSAYLHTGNGGVQNVNNAIPFTTTAEWSSAQIYASFSNYGYDVTADSSGNVYVAAESDGVGLLVKYNSTGAIQWQRTLSTGGYGVLSGVSVDSSGNVYVTGTVGAGVLIAKYNSSGTIQWQRNLGTSGDSGKKIIVDSSSNVYVVGAANDGSVNYGLLAKYDSAGAIQWQRKVTENSVSFLGMYVDASGYVYACGKNSTVSSEGVFLKFNSSGTVQWQRKLNSNSTTINGICADTSGNVYVCGTDVSGTTFGFIAKYDSSGSIQWQQKLSQTDPDLLAISIDSSANVYVSGRDSAGSGSYYGLIAKYNSSGAIQWQRGLYQTDVSATSCFADSSGNLYVTGYSAGITPECIIATKLKQDGTSASGFAGVLTLLTSGATDASGTIADQSGATTSATGTAADSAGTATDATGANSFTNYTQSAVTGKGGLVWIKNRTNSSCGHAFTDTARGAGTSSSNTGTNALQSNSANGTGGAMPSSGNDYLSAFYASGFTVIASTGSNNATRITNRSGDDYVSWSFAKQAKFFDIVTYTGTGANRTISHNLGAVPGCIIVKRTDTSGEWSVYHRSLANTEYLVLNTTAIKATGATKWNSTTPTSSVFSLGTDAAVNANGGTYVAYLFAHNAGGFGSSGTENVITCGSYTGTGVAGNAITLGYEPQFVMFKTADTATGNWFMIDNIRPFALAENGYVYANTLGADLVANPGGINPTATGFALPTTSTAYNANGTTYIYIAIRRGPMRTPTDATKVFSPITANAAAGTAQTTGFVVDSQWKGKRATDTLNTSVDDRLRAVSVTTTAQGRYLITSSTAVEATTSATTRFWNNTGFQIPTYYASASSIFWNFSRAPGFFDVVCYTGTGANTTQSHNLGVAPELMIVRRRSGATSDWQVYHASVGNGAYLVLNTTAIPNTSSTRWNDTTPTSTVFTLGTSGTVNNSTSAYVAYLFASCAGVSKVGSYTGTGNLLTVNCGFSSGARFVMIKRTDTTGDWYVYDSARGISSSNDPYMLFNTTAGDVTSTNYVDTDTTGFKVTAAAPAGLNANGGTYVYMAIA